MRKFITGALIALMGMSASPSFAHGVDGAGRFFVNHADLASYYNEVPGNTNTLFLTVPVGRRFILTGVLNQNADWIRITENGTLKASLGNTAGFYPQLVNTSFATGIPFESETSVYVNNIVSGDNHITLIGYFADLP